MALFEDLTVGSVTSSALIGLGLVVAAPVLLPVVGTVVRPVVRQRKHGTHLEHRFAKTSRKS